MYKPMTFAERIAYCQALEIKAFQEFGEDIANRNFSSRGDLFHNYLTIYGESFYPLLVKWWRFYTKGKFFSIE